MEGSKNVMYLTGRWVETLRAAIEIKTVVGLRLRSETKQRWLHGKQLHSKIIFKSQPRVGLVIEIEVAFGYAGDGSSTGRPEIKGAPFLTNNFRLRHPSKSHLFGRCARL